MLSFILEKKKKIAKAETALETSALGVCTSPPRCSSKGMILTQAMLSEVQTPILLFLELRLFQDPCEKTIEMFGKVKNRDEETFWLKAFPGGSKTFPSSLIQTQRHSAHASFVVNFSRIQAVRDQNTVWASKDSPASSWICTVWIGPLCSHSLALLISAFFFLCFSSLFFLNLSQF